MPTDLRYPVGPFEHVHPIAPAQHAAALRDIAALPAVLRAAVRGLDDAQLDTHYRPDGWTVRQVVHHMADSHMHGLIRVKLALTENTPTIKPYDEHACAMLGDMRLPIQVSLGILDGLHTRWTAVYEAMTPDQWARAFVHPERGEVLTMAMHLQLYSWHSRHHVSHITELRRRQGW